MLYRILISVNLVIIDRLLILKYYFRFKWFAKFLNKLDSTNSIHVYGSKMMLTMKIRLHRNILYMLVNGLRNNNNNENDEQESSVFWYRFYKTETTLSPDFCVGNHSLIIEKNKHTLRISNYWFLYECEVTSFDSVYLFIYFQKSRT